MGLSAHARQIRRNPRSVMTDSAIALIQFLAEPDLYRTAVEKDRRRITESASIDFGILGNCLAPQLEGDNARLAPILKIHISGRRSTSSHDRDVLFASH